MRSNITLFILIFAGSAVYGLDTGISASQIQESGIQVNNESLPPQSALYFAFQIPGFGEIEDFGNWQTLSEESTEKLFLHHFGSKCDRDSSNQEIKRRDNFKIIPGLILRKLIFPHHFHT
ncbi:MAG: hypothetical protein U5K71_05045 [Gracilimonas sp.]|nr:hypothetical protein [Gracilimonas sp.]